MKLLVEIVELLVIAVPSTDCIQAAGKVRSLRISPTPGDG